MTSEPLPRLSRAPDIDWIDRDLTGWLATPLVRGLARWIPSAVHPNGITWTGFLTRCDAAGLLAVTDASLLIVCGLIVFAEVSDAVDGQHARNTGRCSLYGRFLDLVADTMSISLLHACVLIRFDLLQPLWIVLLVIRPVAAAALFGQALVTGQLRLPAAGAASETLLLCCVLPAANVLSVWPPQVSGDVPLAWWLAPARPVQLFFLGSGGCGVLYIACTLRTVATAELGV